MNGKYLEMYALRQKGKTYESIGEMFGMSHQGVRAALKRHFPMINRVFNAKVVSNCLNCSKTFTHVKTPIGERKFCSQGCHHEYRTKNRKPMDLVRERNRLRMHRYRRTEKGRSITLKLQKESSRKFPEKVEARWRLNEAVKSGVIVRPEQCVKCNKFTRVQGHHRDYSRPFDVLWLCAVCHKEEHKK